MSLIEDMDPDNMNEVIAAVKQLRDDFDRLMDAVQNFSVFNNTDLESTALDSLKKVFQENQEKWGG
jgi:hypothetical protein